MSKASLIDIHGQPMKRADAPGSAHRAADRFSQEMARWSPPLHSADSAWLSERNTVSARIHDLAINNGWTSGLLTRYLDQVIGPDISLSARPNWKLLGLDFDAARAWADEAEARFWDWANDPRHYCDARERTNLAGLIGLAFRHTMADGEALGVARWVERSGYAYATAIELIDPDRLSNPQDRMDTDNLRGGVQLNERGVVEGYHIRCAHPGDWYAQSAQTADRYRWEYLPRRVPGLERLQVLHHFEAQRAGQTRGKSGLVPIIEKTKMLDRYERTEMQAALVNAIFAAFITTPLDREETAEAFFGGDGASSYADAAASFIKDSGGVKLDGISMPMLYPGMKPEMLAATRPNQAFAEFERAALRNMAAAAGISYEELAQDWSRTNYSSARAAMLQTWKFMRGRMGAFCAGFATQIYVLWLEDAIDSGVLSTPPAAPAFWDAPAAWSRCKWRGTPRGWVDPTKEAEASVKRMEAGVSSLQDEADEQGKDWKEVLEQRAREDAYRGELGLAPPVAGSFGGEEDADERDAREMREAFGAADEQ